MQTTSLSAPEASTAMVRQQLAKTASLAARSRLLASLAPALRRRVLEELSPPLIAALVQNLQEQNQGLLAELSFRQFSRLLEMCSAHRKFYWVRLALSQEDARAHALPLLLPPNELAEVLLTRVEFKDYLTRLAEYPLESLQLAGMVVDDPVGALVDFFGPQLLREIPLNDPVLHTLLLSIIEQDRTRYAQIIRHALQMLRYEDEHPQEDREIRREPILLAPAALAGMARPRGTAADAAVPGAAADAILPARLVRALPSLLQALPEAKRGGVIVQFHEMAVREAIAEGGSFASEDLAPVVERLEAYLLLGLHEKGGTPDLLSSQRMGRILEAGARVVERLRQVAYRLRPLANVLDGRERALVESLAEPVLTVGDGEQVLLKMQAAGDLPGVTTLEAESTLKEASRWVSMARALKLRRVAAAMASGADRDAVLAGLALGALSYRRMELGLAEAADLERFRSGCITRSGKPTAEAAELVAETARNWARERKLDPDAVTALLGRGLSRLVDVAGSPEGGTEPDARVFLG